MAEAEHFNRKLTYVLWSFLFIGSMYLMLATAAHKTIVIEDTGLEQSGIQKNADAGGQVGTLTLQSGAGPEKSFYIPLGEDCRAEDVVVENCYTETELRVYIKDAAKDFFEDRAVRGDVSAIRQAEWESQKDGVLLRFRMDGVYEFQSSIESDSLRIAACSPHELYRMVVVIDPACGGGETGQTFAGCSEKEIALAVSERIQEQVGREEIRLYFTRTEDTEVPADARRGLAQAVDADLFINIGVGVSEDPARYGIQGWYNESYFIPEFGNVQLADLLTRNVTVAARNRAVGLNAAGEESILQDLSLPAARVEVGYLSNERERALLIQEEYQEKLAEGIAKAIEEIYAERYEQ